MDEHCAEGFEDLRGLLRAALAPHPSWDGLELLVTRGKSRVALVEGERGLFVLKRYQDPLLRRLLNNPFRLSRARREFWALSQLRERHANGIEPVAWGERRRLGLRWISVIITRAWPGSFNLGSLRRLAARGEASARILGRLAKDLPALGRRLDALHAGGCHLGDNLDKNILYRPDARGPQAFAWIDQPHLRQRAGPISWPERFDDLSAILRGLTRLFPAPPGQRSLPIAAFLEAYCAGLTPAERPIFLADPRLRPRQKSPLRRWLSQRRRRLWFALTRNAPTGREKDAVDALSRSVQARFEARAPIATPQPEE